MKKGIIIIALLSVLGTLQAQTDNKQTTVHIKKVEIVDGVKKVTDTTYTTNDIQSLRIDGATIKVQEPEKGGNVKRQTIVVKTNCDDKKTGAEDITIERIGDELSINMPGIPDMPSMDSIDLTGKTLILKAGNLPDGIAPGEEVKIVIIKKITATDATENDLKRIGEKSKADGKLGIKDMNFYPNPNNGKFNLKFTMAEKGHTEITIMNLDGKIIYKERLENFTGAYDKEMDISKESKGIYLVKVAQGNHTEVKKIVLE